MSLNSENGSDIVMPVQPMNNYGGYGGGFGCGGDATWLLILFLFAAMGGWGNGGFGGFGGGSGSVYPYLLANNTDNLVTGGFNQAATAAALGDLQNSVTTGFSNAEVAGCNRAMDAMQTAYGNQIASMNQNFANQQDLDGKLSAMEMALQNCCCENRAGLADLKYTVATEACADRAAVGNALRDVLEANTASTQRILDQMCQDKIDSKNEKIADLERQLTMANLTASQTAQTAALRAGQVEEVDALYNRLSQCPIPSEPVYGRQPIFTCGCGNNNGCGCGCGSF